MELTDLEREFLKKLLGESWGSPPMFDHEIVARLVELGSRRNRTASIRRYRIPDH